MTQSTSLVPVCYQAIAQDPARSIDFIDQMGQKLLGGMKGVNTKGKATVAALIMLTEGLTIPEIEAKYHFMDGGGVQLSSGYMLARLDNIGAKPKWIEDGEDGNRATLEVTTRDGEQKSISFTIEQAKKKGLIRPKSVWDTDAPLMLRARAISRCVDMYFPSIRAGSSDEEYDKSIEVMKERRVTGEPKSSPPLEAEDAEIVPHEQGPFGEPPSSQPAEPEPQVEPSPALRNEIRELVGSDALRKGIASKFLAECGLDAPAKLNEIQSLQLRFVLLLHRAGKHGTLPKVCEKCGVSNVLELSRDQVDHLTEQIKAKIAINESQPEENENPPF